MSFMGVCLDTLQKEKREREREKKREENKTIYFAG